MMHTYYEINCDIIVVFKHANICQCVQYHYLWEHSMGQQLGYDGKALRNTL